MACKTVTFIKPFDIYNGGEDFPDSVQFEEEKADALIAAGIAKPYEGVAVAPEEKKPTAKKF